VGTLDSSAVKEDHERELMVPTAIAPTEFDLVVDLDDNDRDKWVGVMADVLTSDCLRTDCEDDPDRDKKVAVDTLQGKDDVMVMFDAVRINVGGGYGPCFLALIFTWLMLSVVDLGLFLFRKEKSRVRDLAPATK
jgi:hypothetical protein